MTLESHAGQPLREVIYNVRGESGAFTLEQYLTKFCTTGLLVLKDDQIVFERYLQGRTKNDELLSASMSKTVLALLMEIAVKEGKLALDERVAAVLPDFRGSAFADATIARLCAAQLPMKISMPLTIFFAALIGCAMSRFLPPEWALHLFLVGLGASLVFGILANLDTDRSKEIPGSLGMLSFFILGTSSPGATVRSSFALRAFSLSAASVVGMVVGNFWVVSQ